MSLYKTEAVVIGSHNWGEADRMMTLFTRERGVIKAAAFGARRPRSPLAGSMQLFSHVEVSLAEGQRVDTIRQCTLLDHYKWFSEDLAVTAYGAFVAEFLREFLPEGQAEPGAFGQLLKILEAFGKRNPRVTALAAVLQLLEYTGLQLHYEHCVRCGKKIKDRAGFSMSEGGAVCLSCGVAELPFSPELHGLLVGLRDLDWDKDIRFSISGSVLQQAEQLLLAYLRQLMGRPMKSLSFIRQLCIM